MSELSQREIDILTKGISELEFLSALPEITNELYLIRKALESLVMMKSDEN